MCPAPSAGQCIILTKVGFQQESLSLLYARRRSTDDG